jgi:hypothetical protein
MLAFQQTSNVNYENPCLWMNVFILHCWSRSTEKQHAIIHTHMHTHTHTHTHTSGYNRMLWRNKSERMNQCIGLYQVFKSRTQSVEKIWQKEKIQLWCINSQSRFILCCGFGIMISNAYKNEINFLLVITSIRNFKLPHTKLFFWPTYRFTQNSWGIYL